ncbi:glutamate formimidoyltransferase [bacterium]|nr:glutamate formimidoyltransferase [bacterium]
MEPIIECVPNFSEGQNNETIKAIASAIRKIKGVRLLHVDSGFAANRTVYTFVGNPLSVLEAAFQAITVAAELIDMRNHKGEHPRMGACDVCPLIPVSGISMNEVIDLSHQLGKRVGDELNIPVYLYEKSAQQPERVQLANVRKGEYEGLPLKMRLSHWQPDYGPNILNPKSGATILGARNFLIAYNFNLNTSNITIARSIAEQIRESGKYIGKDEQGKKLYTPGKFKALKSIGWFIKDFGIAQVSCNFSDYQLTPLHLVHEMVKLLAAEHDCKVTGAELIGLIPKEALLMAGQFYEPNQTEEDKLIATAIKELGLSDLNEFRPNERIIEFML